MKTVNAGVQKAENEDDKCRSTKKLKIQKRKE